MQSQLSSPVFQGEKTRLRSKIKLFTGLILAAVLTVPLVAILLYILNVDDTIYCPGTVVPEHTYEIASPFGVPVRQIFFKTGMKVNKGDLLIQLNDTEFVNGINQIQAEIRSLQAQVEVQKSALAVQLDGSGYEEDARIVEAEIKSLAAQVNVQKSTLAVQLDGTNYEEEARLVKAEIAILQAQAQVASHELDILRLEPLPENYRHAQPRLKAAQEAYQKACEEAEKFKSVLTPREFSTYEKAVRETELQLSISRENDLVVKNGLGKQLIAKAEQNVKVIGHQIKEKQEKLAILEGKIAECHKDQVDPASLRGKQIARSKDEIQVIEHQIKEKQEKLAILKAKIAECHKDQADPATLRGKKMVQAQREIEVTERKIDEKKVQLKLLEQKRDDCRIYAVEEGTILEIPCKSAMFAERGKPAIIVGSLELMVLAEVDPRFIRKVELDQVGEISSEVFNKLQYGSFDAIVEKISVAPVGTEDPKYAVWMRLDPKGCDIKIGSKAEVKIITGTSKALFWFMNITDEDETQQRLLNEKRLRHQQQQNSK